ncbi:MAG: class I SAM-dependent methyltransferase [Planctomycetia bacterium]
MNDILRRYPKRRPELPDGHRRVYEAHYLANRNATYRTTSISSRMEAWMHRHVAKDLRAGQEPITLEVGAGTLNHLPYEPAVSIYDVVEPFQLLLDHSAHRARIRHTYRSITEVPTTQRYDRIVSIATFEHIEDLPDVVSRCAVLLAHDGCLRVGIPNEGTILWRLGTAVTGFEFRMKYGLDYQTLMRHEHVNTADEIEAVLRCYFRSVTAAVCGISRRFAFYRFLECALPLPGTA